MIFSTLSPERSSAEAPNSNIAFCEALLTELARAGVEHLCICPGSRSAPLAIASLRVPDLYPWVHLDERAAAFFALGLAKASGKAVALFCTSGTAAANFYAAVIEAYYGHVPLIILTADRPVELREWGAGQTIQQNYLFGNHIRWFAEAPLPEPNDMIIRTARSLTSRAFAAAQGKIKGPVHLNLPFREPLTPESVDEEREKLQKLSYPAVQGRPQKAVYTRVFPACDRVPEQVIEELCQQVRECAEGVLLCGEHVSAGAFGEQLSRFSELAAWPVIADPVSQLRFGPHTDKIALLSTGDLLLRSSEFCRRMAPGCIVHIGATLTGKAVRQWALEHKQCRHLCLDEQQRWHDPDHLATDYLSYNPTQLFCQLNNALERDGFSRNDHSWLDEWKRVENIAKEALAEEFSKNKELLEPVVGESLVSLLPDNCDLFLSSSMPVRDIDSFAPSSTKSVRIFSNRGTNGIDGVISSALGVAADNRFKKNRRQTVLLTGDLSFLYDIGGLLAASRNQLALTIIVINNDGGGIFSFLPVSQYEQEAHFEAFFTTPHGLSFQSAAELYGLGYQKVENLASFTTCLHNISAGSGTRLIELCVDRDASVAFQKRLISCVTRSIKTPCQ